MSAPRTPFIDSVLAEILPAMAVYVIAMMRCLEEATTDPSKRWTLLRQRLEQIAKQGE
jgi:hypothetical protein